ncbi:MAG: hypothetical protein IT383_00745 [Deltaproteobacteria bacterium]|nr:hypothetical protein [Deltaproteobacteria bacterium]
MPVADGAALSARARDGDLDAARHLRDIDEADRGAALARAALARERAPVTTADGVTLSLDDTERLLTSKEERGVYRPLRSALDRSLAKLRWFCDSSSVDVQLGARCASFVRGTADLAAAALELLDGYGSTPINDDEALARALDLPGSAFRVDVALALLAAARDAAGLALPSVRVPRSLAGLVVDDGRAKLGVFPTGARGARWSRLLAGGLEVLSVGAGVAPLQGVGRALGAMLPAALARVGVGRREAEQVTRASVARAVLEARVVAALAGGPWEEVLGAALPRPMRPSAALRELLDPRALGGELASSCETQLAAGAVALSLREAWDEAFVLHARGWREPVPMASLEPAVAWSAWARPWL